MQTAAISRSFRIESPGAPDHVMLHASEQPRIVRHDANRQKRRGAMEPHRERTFPAAYSLFTA